MDEIARGSLLLPVIGLMVGFFVLFAWLLSIEFRLYRLSRSTCPGCGGEVSRSARRCPSCGERLGSSNDKGQPELPLPTRERK
jgi:predicted amidophosphoribosyltransferase